MTFAIAFTAGATTWCFLSIAVSQGPLLACCGGMDAFKYISSS